jgi:hypothetical protein
VVVVVGVVVVVVVVVAVVEEEEEEEEEREKGSEEDEEEEEEAANGEGDEEDEEEEVDADDVLPFTVPPFPTGLPKSGTGARHCPHTKAQQLVNAALKVAGEYAMRKADGRMPPMPRDGGFCKCGMRWGQGSDHFDPCNRLDKEKDSQMGPCRGWLCARIRAARGPCGENADVPVPLPSEPFDEEVAVRAPELVVVEEANGEGGEDNHAPARQQPVRHVVSLALLTEGSWAAEVASLSSQEVHREIDRRYEDDWKFKKSQLNFKKQAKPKAEPAMRSWLTRHGLKVRLLICATCLPFT